jgi:hypothetical protein
MNGHASRTVAQSPQNRHASCPRCLPLSTIRRIHRRGGLVLSYTLSSRARTIVIRLFHTEMRQVPLAVQEEKKKEIPLTIL